MTVEIEEYYQRFGNTGRIEIEMSEGIDLIRFIVRQRQITAMRSFEDTQAVDTQEDLEKVRRMLSGQDTQ